MHGNLSFLGRPVGALGQGEAESLGRLGRILVDASGQIVHWRGALVGVLLQMGRSVVGFAEALDLHWRVARLFIRRFLRLGRRAVRHLGLLVRTGALLGRSRIAGVLQGGGSLSCFLLLVLLPLVDLLKDAVFVDFAQLSVEGSCLLGVGHDDLIKNQLSDDVLVDRVLLELKVVVVDRLALDNLVVVGRVIELYEEGMLQHLSGSESLCRIVSEQLREQVMSLRSGLRNQLLPGESLDRLLLFLHVLEVLGASDLRLDSLARHAEHGNQRVQVLLRGVGSDEDPLGEELSDDAANGPHVNRCRVVALVVQVQLGSPVVPRGHILRQVVVLVDLTDLDV